MALLKKKKISEEQYKRIALAIKAHDPFWGELETDILVLLLRVAVKKYDFKPDEFEKLSDEELEKKIADIFHSTDDYTLNLDGIRKLNAIYKSSKGMGLKLNKIVKGVFKQMDKQNTENEK
jgi:hypothetical protein